MKKPAAEITENEVMPIFQMRCTVCHGKRRQEGGLDLRTQASRLKGGKSGPALVPGKPEESLLMKRILSGEMPPAKMLYEFAVRPPSSSEVEVLRHWIEAGAPAAPKTSVVAEGETRSASQRRGSEVLVVPAAEAACRSHSSSPDIGSNSD